MHRLILSTAVILGLAAPAPRKPRALDEITWKQVLRLKRARNYFALRALLAGVNDQSAPARFGRALIEHAFNRPAASNATIDTLLSADSLPDSLAVQLRQLEMDNDLRTFQYAAGLAAAEALLRDTTKLDSVTLHDARNTRRIFAALAGVPPQTAEIRGGSRVRFRQGRIPVTVNDSMRHYVFDTGANLSTMMRSEAQTLRLDVRSARIDVGTSTDRRVLADLAVARRVAIDRMAFHNVVFLVLEDSLLTFPGGFRIPGIIGFPVIEQMGEVHLHASDSLSVPTAPPTRTQRNLAFSGLTLLTPVRWAGESLLCRLDTGANTTQAYQPLYGRLRERIDRLSRAGTRMWGGAGGTREMAIRRLSAVRLGVGDTTIRMDSLDVLTQSIASNEQNNYLDCNLGHDVFDAFTEYVLNFRDMAFLLR